MIFLLWKITDSDDAFLENHQKTLNFHKSCPWKITKRIQFLWVSSIHEKWKKFANFCEYLPHENHQKTFKISWIIWGQKILSGQGGIGIPFVFPPICQIRVGGWKGYLKAPQTMIQGRVIVEWIYKSHPLLIIPMEKPVLKLFPIRVTMRSICSLFRTKLKKSFFFHKYGVLSGETDFYWWGETSRTRQNIKTKLLLEQCWSWINID